MRNLLPLALVIVLVAPAITPAQSPKKPPPAKPPSTAQLPMLGPSTGGTFPPILDSEKRPITVGGIVSAGPAVFEDITLRAGLSGWKHVMGTPQKKYILEMAGSGVALLDYDNDGWLDIYLVNGATYDSLLGKSAPPHAALFHNNRDGTFTDVAISAGVTNDRWGFSVTVGDFDNDGWPDIYVSNYGKNRLYRNNRDGTFTDVAEKAGVTVGGWSTGASFGDYDGDGRLDLFVPGYIHYDIGKPPDPNTEAAGNSRCLFRAVAVMCGPRGLKGEHDHLFRNNGDGTFTDTSEKAGVSDPNGYYGFSSVFVDVNGDGKPDLLVANDSTPNYLYLNKGDGTFEDASIVSGFAFNVDGRETASMGLAVGDYDNDGQLDLLVTTFSDDYKPLWRNDGHGNFEDIAYKVGLGGVTVPFLGWGVGFIDYDNDGWKDIFMANGHAYPQVDYNDWGTTYAQRALLFHNSKGRVFDLVPAVRGTGLAEAIPARGAAFGDLFNDGKISVVINCIDHAPVLLRNVSSDANHWVELSLVGGAKSPRDAIGTTIFLTTNSMRQRGDVMSSGSYGSANDQRVHFGLGNTDTTGKLEIHWPSGTIEFVTLPAVDRILKIEEGKGIVPSAYDSMGKKPKPSTD